MKFRYSDTVHGGQAKATAVIDGKVEEMFFIKSLEASSEKKKDEGYVVGNRLAQHKSAGLVNTGKMAIYSVTSLFRRMMKKFQDTGIDTFFTITVETEDKASTIGRQVTTLYDVNIDSVMVAHIDIGVTSLEEDIPFTFGKWDMPEEFGLPSG